MRARAAAQQMQGLRGGSGICEHGRQRSQCKDCCGASICEHGRVRSRCKDCGGAAAGASTRAGTQVLQGLRRQRPLRAARAASLQLQGVWWQRHLRARAAAQPVQALPLREGRCADAQEKAAAALAAVAAALEGETAAAAPAAAPAAE